MRTFAQNKICY